MAFPAKKTRKKSPKLRNLPRKQARRRPAHRRPTCSPGIHRPAGKVIPPEKLFQFEVDRLELLKKHKGNFLELLKSAKTKNSALIDKFKDANRAIVADIVDLAKKGDITPADYRKTNEDPEAQKANDDYIAKHSEINEKISQLQSEIVTIDTATKAEVERLKITKEDLMGKPSAPAPGRRVALLRKPERLPRSNGEKG